VRGTGSAADRLLSVAKRNVFENGPVAFEQKGGRSHEAEQERIEYLEKKIQTKDEVLAELVAEHIALRKSFGEL
jgi:transposase